VAGSHDLAGVSCSPTMRRVRPGPGAGQASSQFRSGSGEVMAVSGRVNPDWIRVLQPEVIVGSPGGGVVRAQDSVPAGQGPLASGTDPAAMPGSQRAGGLTASSTGSAIRGS
jgi:hypothetical protein